jgi:hypothetical protein
MNKFIGSFKNIGFRLKKHSPEILVVAGVVGVVAGAVTACKATTKVSEILETHQHGVDEVHNAEADEAIEDYGHQEAVKDLAVIYVQTGVNLARLYAPAVGLGVLSLFTIVKSNDILSKRNAALTAAYATISKGFKEYRSRVVERFGNEVDRELRYNIASRTIDSVVVDENGKEQKSQKTIEVIGDIDESSNYARLFDKNSRCWENTDDHNLCFLRAQQQWANDRLQANGYIFLNDVYDMLDIPRSKAGQIVGWVRDQKESAGDGYVDFGLDSLYEKCGDDNFKEGFLLDFNVDGNIWDLM